MNEVVEYRVQYKSKDSDSWTALGVVYETYGEAVEKMVSEAQMDPMYAHRVVESRVAAFINEGGYPA